MDQDAEYLVSGKFQDIDEMSGDEIRQELTLLRTLWDWLGDDVRYYIAKIGSPARVVTRNYKGYFGELLQPHFKLEEIEIGVADKHYEVAEGNYYRERKVLRLPVSAIMHLELVHKREIIEDIPLENIPLSVDADDLEEVGRL